MLTRDGDTTTLRLTHPAEFIRWMHEQPERGEKKTRNKAGSYGFNRQNYVYNNPYDWNQDSTLPSITQLAGTGWHAGTDTICNKLDNIKHVLEEEAHGYKYDVTGQFFDVGLVVSGEPECWLEQDYQPKRRVVSICANIAASGGVNAEKLARRGAAIIALVETLQYQGFIAELSVVTGATTRGTGKASDKTCFVWFDFGTTPLDIDAASLVLAHVGWFRVAMFAAIDCLNGSDGGDRTYCKDLKTEDQQKFSLYIPSGDLRNSNGQELRDDEDAAHWVQQQVEKIIAVG